MRAAGIATALVVCLCYLLPWVDVTVLFATITLSGSDLASGTLPGNTKTEGFRSLTLVPATMVISFVAATIGLIAERRRDAGLLKIAALVPFAELGAGVIALLTIVRMHLLLDSELKSHFMGVVLQNMITYHTGAGLCLAGCVALIAVGLTDLVIAQVMRGSNELS